MPRKTAKQTKQLSLRVPENLGQWLETTANDLGIDQSQLVRYALGQLKAELALAKQVRANLLTQGQSLEQVKGITLNATSKASSDSIVKRDRRAFS